MNAKRNKLNFKRKCNFLLRIEYFKVFIENLTMYVPIYSQSSNLLNQARLRVLKARDEHVSNVLDDGKRQLANITRDKQKYSQLLQGLIAQVNYLND